MSKSLQSALRWLRASYITGAVADALVAVLMLLPSRMGEAEFRYPMGLGASLMLGWTVLLLWADRRPMERKGVLLITICPVLVGLLLTAAWAVTSGYFSLVRVLPSSVIVITLILLFGFSHRKAIRAERQNV